MEHLKGFDRKQAVLFPTAIDEMISDGNFVRVIDIFVDGLDLGEMGFEKARTKKEGRPPYHPGDLLKLYVYGYLNRCRSSRVLEKECGRNMEVMWLLRGLKPDHNTISNFRRDNPKAIKKVFRQTVAIAGNLDLIGGVLIAGDSTKLRAQNSKKNNYNEKKIKRHLEYIERKLEEHDRALAEADGDTPEEEEKREGHRKEIEKHQGRRKGYEKLREELKGSGQKQISTTDPDSRHMIIRNNITEVAYNIQTTTDDKYCIQLDYKVTNENDSRAMGPMVARAKSILRHNGFTVLFDKGYHTARQLGHCHRMGIDTLVAIKDLPSTSHAPHRNYDLENFTYNRGDDTYTCPEGETLKTNGTLYDKRGGRAKQYKTKACLDCKMQYLCTKAALGRVIERNEHADSLERNKRTLKENPDTYRKRQQIVEHPYGTIKRQWGFDHITTKKTMKRASADVGLMMVAYNFRRLLTIIGKKDLGELLKTLFFRFFGISGLYKAVLGHLKAFLLTGIHFPAIRRTSAKRLIFGGNWRFGLGF